MSETTTTRVMADCALSGRGRRPPWRPHLQASLACSWGLPGLWRLPGTTSGPWIVESAGLQFGTARRARGRLRPPALLKSCANLGNCAAETDCSCHVLPVPQGTLITPTHSNVAPDAHSRADRSLSGVRPKIQVVMDAPLPLPPFDMGLWLCGCLHRAASVPACQAPASTSGFPGRLFVQPYPHVQSDFSPPRQASPSQCDCTRWPLQLIRIKPPFVPSDAWSDSAVGVCVCSATTQPQTGGILRATTGSGTFVSLTCQ